MLSGISAGAVNAAGYATFDRTDNARATQFMVDFWREINSSIILQTWNTGVFAGLYKEPSLVNNSIFINYVNEKIVSRVSTLKRKISVGSVDLNKGEFVRFDESTPFIDFIFKAARSSASVPLLFPPVEYEGMSLVDGGTLINLDIAGAVQKCLEIVNDQSDIILDIVMTNPISELETQNTSSFYAIHNGWRAYQISRHFKQNEDLLRGITSFPNVNYRYIVAPEKSLSWGPVPLSFKNSDQLIQMGKNDAQRTVEEQPFRKMIE